MEKKDVIKIIEKVCHSLGRPDFNGENHIYNVDGIHWKELSEKFEIKLENLTKHNSSSKKDCSTCDDCLDYEICKSITKGKKEYCKFKRSPS